MGAALLPPALSDCSLPRARAGAQAMVLAPERLPSEVIWGFLRTVGDFMSCLNERNKHDSISTRCARLKPAQSALARV